MAEETCGNCRYGHGWTMTKHTPPRINVNQPGRCAYVMPEPIWPASVSPWARQLPKAGGVLSTDTDCPCWEGK